MTDEFTDEIQISSVIVHLWVMFAVIASLLRDIIHTTATRSLAFILGKRLLLSLVS